MPETETIEFKKSLAELNEGLVSMAAMLNKHGHGELWFGIKKSRNPGGLLEGMSMEDLMRGNFSRRRNPIIAELLRRVKLVEAWGRGIPLILERAPKVQFQEKAGLFITTLPRPPETQTPVKTRAKTTQETTQEKILAMMRANSAITRKILAANLGISDGGVKYHLDKLRKAGLIQHTGATKAGHWEVFDQ